MSAQALRQLHDTHARAQVDTHLEVLFKDIAIGGELFLPLYRRCMAQTGTKVQAWKSFRRAQRALTLAQYFLHALEVDGEHAECGVYKGFSALLLCEIARLRDPACDGADVHLVDSYQGLSAPTRQDAFESQPADDGRVKMVVSHGPGALAASLDHVQQTLAAFSGLTFWKGWIPDVLDELPETRWAFVHLDVDLYQPTLDGLEYFYPRLSSGGVIVNDDYRSALFPGAGRAWDAFCSAHNIPFVALDTGQAVILKP